MGVIVIWGPWILICLLHCWATSQNPRTSNDSNALKMNIIVILSLTFATGASNKATSLLT